MTNHLNTFCGSLWRSLIFLIVVMAAPSAAAQSLPYPALIGYWQNWSTLPLTSIDARYNVIEIAFPLPATGTDYNFTKLDFGPHNSTTFKAGIATLQGQGRKVLLSLGGATAPVYLNTKSERATFVSSVGTMLTTYGFDGIDIDLESSSMNFTKIKMSNNTDSGLVNLIQAVKDILANYQTARSKRCLLTMAPEVMYVQGGYATPYYKSGAYLPIINAFKNDIDMLQVQLYNVGQAITALDNLDYSESDGADFIVAMTEMVLKGFTASQLSGGSGVFAAIPEGKVAVGLPACANSAGSGFATAAVQKQAIDYLRGVGAKPGSYTLKKVGGYPNLGGMMTWSINTDVECLTTAANGFASSFATIFNGVGTGVSETANSNTFNVYPNPAQQQVTVDFGNSAQKGTLFVYNALGQLQMQQPIANAQRVTLNIALFPAGVYFVQLGNVLQKMMKVD